jgi:SRSO17 transposase
LQARSFLLGVLSDVDTRSCWQLAKQAGDGSPQAMQRLLGEAVWDADAVRDDVRGYVMDTIGDPGAVLILDDTGDLKAGVHTAGVQRQYTGTTGRIENAQVSVFLAYATPDGRALIDRAVYLPVSWAGDRARCAAAGIPDDVGFATKITIGRRMLERALDAGVPAGWATADEFYGGDRGLRRDLQARRLGYVLAVAKSHREEPPRQRRRQARHCSRRLHRCHPGQTGVEPLQRWQRSERTPRLRLGLGGRHPTRRRSDRIPLAAHPPPHRRR